MLRLPFVRLSQADNTNIITPKCVNHDVNAVPDQTERNPSFLAIVGPVVNGFNGSIPTELFSEGEINPVFSMLATFFLSSHW
jgi:hypothetical protein